MKAQARQLVRLRQSRMDAARTALAEARAAADRAADTLRQRAAEARAAVVATSDERAALARDPALAGQRLALVERRRFDEALAAERQLDAERAETEARYHEELSRAALIRAQRRHEALDTHVAGLARAEAVLAEEREAIEAERTGAKR